MFKDKRRHPRVIPLSTAPVEVQIMGNGFLEVLHAEDISVGGIAIHAPLGFTTAEMDETVKLIVTIPGARCFMATGLIRQTPNGHSSGRFGIEFSALDESARSLIGRYVERMLARGRGA